MRGSQQQLVPTSAFAGAERVIHQLLEGRMMGSAMLQAVRRRMRHVLSASVLVLQACHSPVSPEHCDDQGAPTLSATPNARDLAVLASSIGVAEIVIDSLPAVTGAAGDGNEMVSELGRYADDRVDVAVMRSGDGVIRLLLSQRALAGFGVEFTLDTGPGLDGAPARARWWSDSPLGEDQEYSGEVLLLDGWVRWGTRGGGAVFGWYHLYGVAWGRITGIHGSFEVP